MSRFRTGLLRVWVLALLLGAGAGCLDAVVGYPCAAGFTVCGSSCVNLQSSADNCGACGNPCEGRCVEGLCLPSIDAGGDPGSDAGGDPGGDAGGDPGADAGQVDPGLDAAPADGPDTRIDAGADRRSDGALRDATEASSDAGTPDVSSDAGAPDAPEPDASAVDLPPDEPPPDAEPPLSCDGNLQVCGARCVQTEEDPDHCGGCGNRCSSGLCVAAVCQAQGVGHLVVIGHDYVNNRPGMNNLLGNAILLAPTSPTAVLVYEGDAARAAIDGANVAINQVTSARGRGWTRTVASANEVVARLSQHEVFLIYAQDMTDDSGLIQLGQDWAAALSAFIASGKTIVLLDGDTSQHSGTYQILEAAGLFTANARIAVTGQSLTVVAAGDAVALNVPRSYLAEFTSVGFDTDDSVKVVETTTDLAVVIHRVF